MKTSEIREMSREDIIIKIAELQDELFDLRMQKATAALEKPHKIKEIKKTIARMKTILTEMTSEGGNK
ncbi:MAG: 50S ribosomal protein L29 [Bacilli bacterium]|jgi:large subunit ribosomal protein L29|nr:50S ribosomal protein L29 [Bacilli bacterium]